MWFVFRVKKKSNRVEASSTSEVPAVPETKFFEVASSLSAVFDDTKQPFSLFGSHSEASEEPVAQAAAADDDDDDDGIYDSDDDDATASGKPFSLVRGVFLKMSAVVIMKLRRRKTKILQC